MSQEIKDISVVLIKNNSDDLLEFNLSEKYTVNLNSDNSQNELKVVFSKLLEELIKNPIELSLTYSENYKSGLYIDVCKEYIKELNKEIKEVLKKYPINNSMFE